MSSSDSVLVRAAASSMASGRPSSERHRSSTASSALGLPGRCAAARRVNSSTASGSARGARSNTVSPSTYRGIWLVHRTRTPGAASSTRTASAAAASTTCSQLSRITTAVDAPEPLEQRRLTAGNVHGGHQHVDDLLVRRRGLEPGQPHPTGQRAIRQREPAPHLHGDSRLPDSPGPTISTSRSTASRSHEGSQLDLTADQLHRHRRQVPDRRAGHRRPGRIAEFAQRGILGQDLRLQPLQPRSGVKAELVGQQGPDPLVGRQRVRLAPGPVQRGDQQLPQPLPDRVAHDQRLELPDQLAARPQQDPGRQLVLDQPEAHLLQAGPVRDDPVPLAGAREHHVAAEHRQRPATDVHDGRRVTGGQSRRRELAELGSLEGIDGARVDLERIPAGRRRDDRRVTQRTTQLRDLRLQRVALGRDPVRTPQVLDEALDPDRHPGIQGQPNQQLRGLARRNREQLPVATELERAEHRKGEHHPRLGAAASSRAGIVSSRLRGRRPCRSRRCWCPADPRGGRHRGRPSGGRLRGRQPGRRRRSRRRASRRRRRRRGCPRRHRRRWCRCRCRRTRHRSRCRR